MDLDQSGLGFQKTKVYLGPSLGWVETQILPSRVITTPGTHQILPGDSTIFVDVAGSVTLILPNVIEWVKETAYQPATGFGRLISVKDMGNGATFPITVQPFDAQKIDDQLGAVTITQTYQSITFAPVNDLTGWWRLNANTVISGSGNMVLPVNPQTNRWISSIDVGGNAILTQPAFSNISGTAQVSQGGTGLTAGNQWGIPYFNTTTQMLSTTTAAQGQLLVGNLGGPPSWTVNPVLGFAGSPGTLGLKQTSGANVILASHPSSTTYTFRFPVDPGASGQILQSDGTGQTVWVSTPVFSPNDFVKRAGDTMTGSLIIDNNNPQLALTSDAGHTGQIFGINKTANQARWSIQLMDGAPETGGNTGNNFSIRRYSDVSTVLDDPLTFSRATGLGTVLADPTAPLGIATKAYVDSHSAGSITEPPNDTRLYGRIQTSGVGAWAKSVPLTGTVVGDPITGSLTINTAAAAGITVKSTGTNIAQVNLDKGASGTNATVSAYTNGSPRWAFILGNITPEANVADGSNIQLVRYNNAGTALSPDALTISRATGLATVAGDPTDPLGIATKQYSDLKVAKTGDTMTGTLTVTQPAALSQIRVESAAGQSSNILLNKPSSGQMAYVTGATAGIARWGMFLGNSDPESGSNSGSNFSIIRYADGTGTVIDQPITIARSTGQTNFNVTTDSTAPSNGAVTILGGLGIAKQTWHGGIVNVNVAINNASALRISTPAGSNSASMSWLNGTAERWRITGVNNTSETGGNVGSGLGIAGFADDGTTLLGGVNFVTFIRSNLSTAFSQTTDSTAVANGAVTIAGGLGVAKTIVARNGIFNYPAVPNGSNALLVIGNMTDINGNIAGTASQGNHTCNTPCTVYSNSLTGTYTFNAGTAGSQGLGNLTTCSLVVKGGGTPSNFAVNYAYAAFNGADVSGSLVGGSATYRIGPPVWGSFTGTGPALSIALHAGLQVDDQSIAVTGTSSVGSTRGVYIAGQSATTGIGLYVNSGNGFAGIYCQDSILCAAGNNRGMGYTTGAGGQVTQITSRTTPVTLNRACGAITLVSAAGTTAWQTFNVSCLVCASTDTVRVCQASGTDKYMIFVTRVTAGGFDVTFATTGGTTVEQPVFNFSVLKGAFS